MIQLNMKEKIHFFKDIGQVWPLLTANILYYLGMGVSSAVTEQEIYAVLSPRLISLNSAIGWSVGILLGFLWSKFGKNLLKFLIPLHIAQLVLYSIFFVYFETSLNMFMFWLLGLMNYIFLGGICDKIFECACAWFFKKSEERASYDNLEAMASCLSGCLGNLIAVAYVPSLRMAIFFNWIATFLYCFFVLLYAFPRKMLLKKPDDIVEK